MVEFKNYHFRLSMFKSLVLLTSKIFGNDGCCSVLQRRSDSFTIVLFFKYVFCVRFLRLIDFFFLRIIGVSQKLFIVLYNEVAVARR